MDGTMKQLLFLFGAFVLALSYTAYDRNAKYIEARNKPPETVTLERERVVYVDTTELFCLQKNIFYEAGVEDLKGKYAVAQVTLNRVESDRYPNTICEVVYQPYQFSWANDIESRWKRESGPLWEESGKAARDFLIRGKRVDRLADSLWYHRKDVKPNWSSPEYRVASIGVHVFYNNDRKK